MPAVTVDELLGTGALGETRLVAGAAGLGREVTWAVSMRSHAPLFPVLRGGELVLLAAEALSRLDPPVSLVEMIERLAGRGVAGILALGDVPTEAWDTAEHHVVPLLVGSPTLTLPELESAANRAITDGRARLYQEGLTFQRGLMELALAGRGTAGILEALVQLLGRAVALQDGSMRLVEAADPAAGSVPKEMLDRLVVAAGDPGAVRGAGPPSSNRPSTVVVERGGWQRLTAPLYAGGRVSGYLSVVGPIGWVDGRARLALVQAANVCALELAREEAVVEAESRLRGDVLADLLSGGSASQHLLASRARRLGFDLAQSATLVAIGLEGTAPAIQEDLLRLLLAEAAGWARRPLVGPYEGVVALVIPLPEHPDRVVSACEAARAVVAMRLGLSELAAGVGRYYPGLAGLRQSWQEARQALRIAQHLFGGGRTEPYERLGVFRLLLGLAGNPELARFYEEVLGPLDRYDRRHRTELVRTLEALIACDGGQIEAAAALHIHRNTLAYRLGRIEELAGRRLRRLESLFELQLALKIRQTIQLHQAKGDL